MSTFMISPSSNLWSTEGIPWHATLFIEVQTDLGKPQYLSGDG